MKSCLSILIAILILVIFIGSAALIWYSSSKTEFKPGPEAQEVTP